ncbi:histidine kinase [Sporolactobacillus sp. THM19-2]|uniref:histidine kinase n=1 Tax=Sporolactobacillus sp. THM19-2 TaxID=2511171 RepID=UPI00101F84B5|nr:histidine kinase [Sporolactobacillus sp. THM19-2]RYL89802.1 hypothetical protein EWH91_10180 [Sporolactobacillus sp. THM19-2]
MQNEISRQLQKHLFFISMITVIVLVLHFTISIIDKPYIGVYTEHTDQGYTVQSVAPFSWGSSAHIRPGDRILSVDGKLPSKVKSMTAYEMIGQAGHIDLLRENEVIRLSVDQSVSKSAMFFFLVIPAAFFLICFSFACFLHMKKEINPAVPVLIALLIVVSPLLLEMSANARHDSWSLKVTSFSLVFTLILLVHFMRVYFGSFGFFLLSRWLLGCLYLCGGLIVLHSIFIEDRSVSAYYPQELIFSVFVFLLLCVLLARLYRRIEGSEYRRMIQLLMAGFFLTLFPFVAFYALPNMLTGTSPLPVEWTTPFALLLPLTLCIPVLSGVFIDMSFEISRLGYYSLLSFCMTLVTLSVFLIFIREQLAGNPGEIMSLGILVFSTGILALYVREYLDHWLRKHEGAEKRARQESLNRFLQWSKTEYTLDHVALMLREIVTSHLPALHAEVVRIGSDKEVRTLNGNKNRITEWTSRLQDHTEPVSGMWKSPSGMAVLLKQRKDENLLLVCIWRKPVKMLNLEERMWLETLLNYAKVVIENLDQTDRLLHALRRMETDRSRIPPEMNRFLFSLSEYERKQLARDLHDTAVQDQLAIAREIDMKIRKTEDAKIKGMLTYARERVLDLAGDLRKIIRAWYPEPALKKGPGPALNELIEQVSLSAGFFLETHIDPIPKGLKREGALCLYRAAQELLDHVAAHTGARHVFLAVRFDGAHVLLIYRDDGAGIDDSQIDPSFSTMGLPGLISRVEGLGGSIRLTQAQEKPAPGGLAVRIDLPAGNDNK